MQPFPQSLSLAVSVITLVLPTSSERTVTLKFPLSVATVIVERPLPGGPLTGLGVGFGITDGLMVGVEMGDGFKVGVGDGEDGWIGVEITIGKATEKFVLIIPLLNTE